MIDNEAKLKYELETFNDNIKIHDLPEIFHYWSNKYLRPMLEEYGISNPDDLFVEHMFNSASLCNVKEPLFISIGAGNCDAEVRIAKRLKEKGLQTFCIECLELNPNMLKRGRELAIKEGVIDNLSFTESDFNQWHADKEYVSVIANQSLHHIQNLEGVFNEIKRSLHEKGAFITSDMIGRNGHQRWPEALKAVHHFWKELPESYKYNHQLKRLEPLYENWDCSTEGFEGIRAQDVLPLLTKHFNFQLFIGFSNVIDIFIDRSFGHNFSPGKSWDTDFIDRIHEFDENSIRNGTIKPTHMMAVMKKHSINKPNYSRGISPKFSLRKPIKHMICKSILDNSEKYASMFNKAEPFKHFFIDNFFEQSVVSRLVGDFPQFQKENTINESGYTGGKAVVSNISKISEFYKDFYEYIISQEFLNSVSKLTGIPDLLADLDLYGAGTHENIHGQWLDVHVDFNYSEKNNLHRRLNMLVYLNEEWEDSWGGSIELHSDPRNPGEDKFVSFSPQLNRAVVFETNEYSWHGFEKINLPDNKRHLSRKCISIYFYTKDRPKDEIVPAHGTFYIPRPLPKYFKPGLKLSLKDVGLLEELLKVRDDSITMYQNKEIEWSRVLKENLENTESLSALIKIPCGESVEQNGVVKGFYHDGWMSKKMTLSLLPSSRLTELSILGNVPKELGKDVTLTAFIDGAEVSSNAFSCGSFKWRIFPKHPISKDFILIIKSDSSFIPNKVNASHDKRELSVYINLIESSH